MTEISSENKLFQKVITRVNNLLKVTGLHFNKQDAERSIKQCLSHRWFFCINYISTICNVFCQIAWLVKQSYTGISLVELTYAVPCSALSVLGCVKSWYFVKRKCNTHKLINTLNILFTAIANLGQKEKKKNKVYLHRQIKFLSTSLIIMFILNNVGLILFFLVPIVRSIWHYYITGELKLLLPFLLRYPFDPFDIRIWPFVYIHQVWSAIFIVFIVFGPDSLQCTSCVLLNVQFFQLKQEIESIFDEDVATFHILDIHLRLKLEDVIGRHKKLLYCGELIEKIFSESTLLNILTSSLLICFAGFNVMASDSVLVAIQFIPFLLMVLGQIYLLCYYGDLIYKSSSELSDAVYNSGWYRVKVNVVKNLMIISTRAQKPCEITAFGFTVINMQAFTKIMSTSWSYFALLLSFRRNN